MKMAKIKQNNDNKQPGKAIFYTRMWNNRNCHSLLVVIKYNTPTWPFLIKLTVVLPESSNLATEYFSKQSDHICLHKYLHVTVYHQNTININ